MKPEDVDVTVEGEMLTIRGEIRSEEDHYYLIREHRQGGFTRPVRLPENVNPDDLKATFDNGMRQLALGRTEKSMAKRTQITSGGRSA